MQLKLLFKKSSRLIPIKAKSSLSKLTSGLIIVLALLISESVYSQAITLNSANASLESVLESVSKQSGYKFFYNQGQVAKANPVTVSIKNLSLKDALDEVFKNQPVAYAIANKTIVVTEKAKSGKQKSDNLNDEIINGTIIDKAGLPLPGVNVQIKGSTKGTQTNVNGGFSLSANQNDVLVFSFIGFKKKEVTVGKSTTMNIVMEEESMQLNEVVTIAYGTAAKRFQIGSVSTLKSSEIEKQPVMNVALMMQGLMPGLIVSTSGGAPGAQQKLQLRGQNTIQSASYAGGINPFDQPLILIDGIPFAPQNNSLGSTKLGGNGVSPLNSLNPADIESITALKDADATSIYGSQGLNGVILITTKKGKAGKPSLKIDAFTAPEKATRVVEMLNTQQYLSLRKEALKNDGVTNFTPYQELSAFDSTKYTNWFQKFYGGTAINKTVNASLSGGNADVTYLISTGLTKATYNFPGDFKNERVSIHSGFSYNPANSKISVDFGTDFSYNTDKSATAEFTKALLLPPNLPDMLNSDGSLVWNYKGKDFSPYQMQAQLLTRSEIVNKGLNSSLRLAYKLLPGLNISTNLGYSYFYSDRTMQAPRSSYPPSQASSSNAMFNDDINQTLNVEPQAEYRKKISKGNLTVLLGGTYKNQINSVNGIQAYNYANDAFINSPNGGDKNQTYLNNSISPYKYIAAFGRVNYVYDDKYIINITGRRDGSSNFGPNRQFGNFGSAGLGWIFSEEAFFKKAVPFINFAKVSANYGTVGSDGIGPYLFQDYWTRNTNVVFQGVTPYQPNKLYNPDFSWGLKKMWNITSEFAALDNRINLNLSWYQNRTSNQLTWTPLPSQVGMSSVFQNLDATVENKGWEILISSENVRSKDFSWRSSLNVSVNRNKLIEYNNLANSSYKDTYTIGRSTSTMKVFQYKGVNETTGVFEYYKADGKTPTSNPANPDDKVAMVDLQPKFTGGFSNSFTYKGFDLSFLFQFVKQMGYNHLYNLVTEDYPLTNANKPAALLDLNRWQKPGDKNADLQRLGNNGGSAYYFRNSTAAFGDASYIRLKNVSLSYAFRGSWLEKVKVQNLRVYVNAQNLLTITGYKLGDPEMNGNLYGIPPQRTVAFGTSLTF
ncbi:SusC/RagA family TonB-linked outer membrane protein [Solitalea lacus]|uniref:SusC/RagA family TonB-linked outer membrane protein n=1 Tax=Solitalea lacus TaxID=2911172 RepID=UPI001EDBBB48|nr:SusC/RagA family TonB-linked outer membrane protein [Solitalea lacus]UKJ06763.1 SusC/RagA family TonB-linked outer membrane protein [Solitalea lacus]